MALVASLDLADANQLAPGQIIRASTLQDMGRTQNWCRAEGGCGPVIVQGFDDTAMTHSGVEALKCLWFVPYWSTLHTAIEIRVEATETVAGNIRFASGAASVNQAVAVGPRAEYLMGPLVVTDLGGYGLVEMHLTSLAGQIDIHRVSARYLPLTTPIPNGVWDGYTPIGENELAADQPLSQVTGLEMLGNLRQLSTVPRVICSHSGGGAQDYLYDLRPYFGSTRLPAGLRRQDEVFTAIVRARNLGASDTYVRILAGNQWDAPEVVETILIGAGVGTVDKIVTFAVPEQVVDLSLPLPNADIGLWVGQDDDTFTDAEVLTFSAWSSL